MNFKPILFSTPMILALLQGRKTQTRRIINPQPVVYDAEGRTMFKWSSGKHYVQGDIKFIGDPFAGIPHKWSKGDILWVRETFVRDSVDETNWFYIHKAGNEKYPLGSCSWKPSIHMPKSACRIWLEITDIRVERVTDISEEDAKAEGVLLHERGKHWLNYQDQKARLTQFIYNRDTARDSFKTLWDMVNGWHEFEKGRWVWAISFKLIDKPENF